MDQKMKFIIIGLVALLMMSIFFNFSTLNSKAAMQREKDRLSGENTALSEKLNKLSKDYQRIEDKSVALSRDLDVIRQEKEEIQSRYDSLDKTREELIEQIKSLKAKTQSETAASQPAIPTTPDAYWAQVLKTKTNLEMQLDSVRNELKTVQINNEQVQREKSALEFEIKNLDLEKQDLKRQLAYSQKQFLYNQRTIDSVALELVGEKNDKTELKDTFKALKNENLILRRQLRNLNYRKIALERKNQDIQASNSQFDKKVGEMGILLKDKSIQIENLKGVPGARTSGAGSSEGASVELPPIVVRPQQSSRFVPSTGQVEKLGRVLSINKENNFAIIDLGQDAGIKVGDTFQIIRDNAVVASVEVIQARKSISACDIKQENVPIRIGDTVR